MHYRNHYLTNVILRIDFVSSISELKTHLQKEISDVCIKYFKIMEEKKLESKQVIVSNNPALQDKIVNIEKLSEWHFFGLRREKELVITDKCIFVDYKKGYTTFEDMKNPFFEILGILKKTYSELGIKRIGLRYIDQISLEYEVTENWFDYWKRYINEDLLHNLKFAEMQKYISRNMSTLEENFGTYFLRFQYGIFNTDYPSPNKKNTFILDTDVYYDGIIDKDEVEEKVSLFHDEANKLFEKSISEELREKMGKIE